MGQSLDKSIYLPDKREAEGFTENEVKMEEEVEEMLGFTPRAPRHRSWEIDAREPRILLRGRCGGGNYEEYEERILWLESQEGLIESYDDDFDETYRIFVFSLDKSKWIAFLKRWEKCVRESTK